MSTGGDEVAGWKVSRKMIIATGLVIVAAGGTIAAAYALHLFNLGIPTPNFTIIMTNQGFNGSRAHTSDPWPVMNVLRGQVATIHLENMDTTESHGFAITHYLDSGVQLRPGQSFDVVFTASQSGTFLVYCNIICTIHTYMQNGRLNVA